MSLDQKVLLWLNQVLSSAYADLVFTWVSQRMTFALPLFLVLMAVMRWRFLSKGQFFPLILALIICVAVSDQLGNFIKNLVGAPRPCDDFFEYAREGTRALTQSCQSFKGMPSNHAMNFAVVTTFITLVVSNRGLQVSLWLICLLVGVSRIYLAKHYPSQVLTGFLLGVLLANIIWWLMSGSKFFGKLHINRKNNSRSSHV